ncbi:MAG: hypothetical protein ACLP0J_02280 [Solirubrobacteraceae bacterium]
MLRDARPQRLGLNVEDLGLQEAATRDYLAGSAQTLAAGQPSLEQSTEARLSEERMRAAELKQTRAAHARAVRKQIRAEWRASLTPKERVVDSFRELRRLRALWPVLSIAVAGAVGLAAGLAAGSAATLVECVGLCIVAIALARRAVERRRARQLPDGFADRVSDQLDRVKATVRPVLE